MYSTTQQTAYYVPTARRSAHHSQIPFDSTVSLTVKPMARGNTDLSGENWKNNYGRGCWTADVSRYDQTRHSQHQVQRPIVVHPLPGYRRSNTSMGPSSDQSHTVPATASLPKKGLVKLTSLDLDGSNHLPKTRAKTTAGVSRVHRKNRQHDLGHPAAVRHDGHDFFRENVLSDFTVADLQTVIDTEFPETQGLAFNRASHFIRTATADLIRTHSRPVSHASNKPVTKQPVPEDKHQDNDIIREIRSGRDRENSNTNISSAKISRRASAKCEQEKLSVNTEEERPVSRTEKTVETVRAPSTDIIVNIPTS